MKQVKKVQSTNNLPSLPNKKAIGQKSEGIVTNKLEKSMIKGVDNIEE